MNVFISYSTHDTDTVAKLAAELRQYANVYYWDQSKVPGQDAWQTIFQWIDSADLVFVVITGNTVHRAMSVGQEIGRANSKNKTIIPLVSREVPSTELGFLSGITYQPIDVWNPAPAIQQVALLASMKKQGIENGQNLALTVIAVGFLVWLFSDN
jgi:TIR domain